MKKKQNQNHFTLKKKKAFETSLYEARYMKVGTLLISELYSMLKSKHSGIAVQHK